MIYTHTSNPSIDYYIELDSDVAIGIQKAKNAYYLAGGKGINCSMILNQWNIQSIATTYIGGFTGDFIRTTIENSKLIKLDSIYVSQTNRINVKIRGNNESDINTKGISITNEDQTKMLEKFKCLEKNDWLMICGSLAENVDEQFLIEASKIVNEKEAYLVLDVPGIKAKTIARCKPTLIKPNIDELFDMFDLKEIDDNRISELISKLQKMNVANILLSKGAKGADYYTLDTYYEISHPALNAVSTIGSGDSLLATFVGKLSQGECIEEALAWGAAAGEATAISEGLATLEKMKELKMNVRVNKIERR